MMVLVRDLPRRTVLVNYVSTTLAEVTVSLKFETPVNNISPFLSRLPLTLSIAFHAYLKANPGIQAILMEIAPLDNRLLFVFCLYEVFARGAI